MITIAHQILLFNFLSFLSQLHTYYILLYSSREREDEKYINLFISFHLYKIESLHQSGRHTTVPFLDVSLFLKQRGGSDGKTAVFSRYLQIQ